MLLCSEREIVVPCVEGSSHFLFGSCSVLGSASPRVLQEATFNADVKEAFIFRRFLMFTQNGCFLSSAVKSLADKMLSFSASAVIFLCDKKFQHLVFTIKQLILIEKAVFLSQINSTKNVALCFTET